MVCRKQQRQHFGTLLRNLFCQNSQFLFDRAFIFFANVFASCPSRFLNMEIGPQPFEDPLTSHFGTLLVLLGTPHLFPCHFVACPQASIKKYLCSLAESMAIEISRTAAIILSLVLMINHHTCQTVIFLTVTQITQKLSNWLEVDRQIQKGDQFV